MIYKAEIISNQSIEEDIIELLEERIPDIQYTLLPEVKGRGGSSKKLGNTIWPELNFILFAYTDLNGIKIIKEIINFIKQKFPSEGVSLFISKSEE